MIVEDKLRECGRVVRSAKRASVFALGVSVLLLCGGAIPTFLEFHKLAGKGDEVFFIVFETVDQLLQTLSINLTISLALYLGAKYCEDMLIEQGLLIGIDSQPANKEKGSLQ